MKKILFIMMMLVCVYMQAQSPITLTQSNTNLTPGVMNPVGGTVSLFTMPSIGADQQWNYSSIGATPQSPIMYRIPNSPLFPQATYLDSGQASSLIASRYFYYNIYYQSDTAGVKALGTTVLQQNYGIGALTGNNLDSCNFPAQYYVYGSPSWVLKFPTTMSSAWHCNYTNSVDFNLTIASQSLNNTPSRRISHIERTDTVIAWGTLRVPTTTGPSLAYPVILIKRLSVQKDSFYMNGSPAPPALLTTFGLSQNMATTSNRYLFWRENCRYPLMLVNFGSNNFTTASSIFYDGDAQHDPNWDITDLSNSQGVSVYPNPNNGLCNVEFANNTGKPCSISIYNIFGQEIYKDSFYDTGLISRRVNINEAGTGIYQLVVSTEEGSQTFKMIVR